MKYRYVIWDWNGTVLDDLAASLDAVNDLLLLYNKNTIGLREYYDYVDTPIYKFYERLFDLNVVPMSEIKPLYGRFYAEHDDEIVLAEGVDRAIDILKKCGVRQYILSAANIDDLSRYAKKLGVYDKFDRIEAATDYDAGSKVERGLRLIREENIIQSECVMVGDTLHDFEVANAIGVDCILYSKGHADIDTLKEMGSVVCTSMEEIVKNIMK